ncbi:MAG TPA: cysteine desulfurase [Gemmatimonadaceae bacterium]|nr:cysteine desulfurase [Gemmatimonadaceae bacterium]
MLVSRSEFPLLAANAGLRYLDSAATAQKPRVVLDAIREYYTHDNANPHRGAYALSVRATERYHESRVRVAEFIGAAGDPDRVLFTRGTTESLNLVAYTWGEQHVGAGDRIITTRMDHHGAFVPFQQLARRKGAEFVITELTPSGELDLDHFRSLLDGRVKLVVLPHVSNVLGTINPVAQISRLAHEAGAVVVCDGAQAVPHLRVNVEELGVDFFAFSGHKMGAPMGSGGLFGRRELLEAMPPWMMGGDMIEFVRDQDTTWNVVPHKFEAGTPNVEGAVGLAAAATWLLDIGMDNVRAHELALLKRMMEKLSALEGVKMYGPPPDRRSGAVSFSVDGVHPHDLSQLLDADGICIRAGHHCAQPLTQWTHEPATARASVWVYNDESDVDALAESVSRARSRFGVLSSS